MNSIFQDEQQTQPDGGFSLNLLDAAQGRALQTWKFPAPSVVSIGRLEDNDVVLANPIVSRLHATIKESDGKWELISLGRHGVLVDEERVECITLQHEAVFQLGPNGPVLQFINPDQAVEQESQINCSTFEFDPAMFESLRIDEEQAAEEVREITENEGFHDLLNRAREMRGKRPDNQD